MLNDIFSLKHLPLKNMVALKNALSKTDYLHDLDDDNTNESLNLGFTYIPQNIGGSIVPDITDNRINKSTIPYETVDVAASLAK